MGSDNEVGKKSIIKDKWLNPNSKMMIEAIDCVIKNEDCHISDAWRSVGRSSSEGIG